MSGTETYPHAQWAEALRRFDKAQEDRRAAEHLLSADPPLLDPAAYHCQQTAEKLLKGLLAAAGKQIPKTHDLPYLAEMSVIPFSSLSAQIQRLSALTSWGTESRYPGLDTGLGLSVDDIHLALKDISQLQDSIAQLACP